jgi:hypothetical protein
MMLQPKRGTIVTIPHIMATAITTNN